MRLTYGRDHEGNLREQFGHEPPTGPVPLGHEECRALLARNTIGRVALVAAGSPQILPVTYGLDFSVLGSAGWLTGLILGLVHGVVAGMVMKMMGQTHPRMEPVANFTGDESWRRDQAGLHLAKPGWFGKNYGAMTPMGLLMAHAVFGLVVGSIYAAMV